MSDQLDQQPPQFPQYRPPQGIPIADRKQAGLLMKAMNSLRRSPKRTAPKGRGRTGHISPSTIKIGHKKRKFY